MLNTLGLFDSMMLNYPSFWYLSYRINLTFHTQRKLGHSSSNIVAGFLLNALTKTSFHTTLELRT